MRGSKAKGLRRVIYGDNSHRTREYDAEKRTVRERVYRNGRPALTPLGTPEYRVGERFGTIQNKGLRRQYQILKQISRKMA